MNQVISTERIPIKMWLDDIEEGALTQAKNIANLPFAFKYIVLMPDCHFGYGMPVGAVLATKDNIIIPNAVGVDIGCGMCAIKTSLTEINIDKLKRVVGRIRELVPVGFKHHKEKQDEKLMPYHNVNDLPDCAIVEEEYANALKQLGTLGGGNHFIEIQMGSDGFIWVMIHSGSRNIGYKTARYYNETAIELNKKWYSSVPKEHELAFLPLYSEEGKSYFQEMQYCVKFALANRELMMDRAKQAMKEEFSDVTFDDIINIAHNYASIENHFGKNVVVHRKGATQAYKDQLGIIPGSQGTKSYIVKGKGCELSFKSCSHGAGRKMGRNQARKTLSIEQEVTMLNNLGILHSIRGVKDLDEAPSAYKDINVVMKNQEDLVDIIVELTPLAVVKG